MEFHIPFVISLSKFLLMYRIITLRKTKAHSTTVVPDTMSDTFWGCIAGGSGDPHGVTYLHVVTHGAPPSMRRRRSN